MDEEKPDLVLLDLMLPGTDGIELMKDILGAGDVPVIFVSAYGRDELIARAFDMGAVDYVVKPFWTSSANVGSPKYIFAEPHVGTAWGSRRRWGRTDRERHIRSH